MNTRKILFALLAVFIIAALGVGSYYQSLRVYTGTDTTYGDELRFGAGTYDVPVIPESAITGTIAFGVASPYTVQIGRLPAGAVVTDVDVFVTTAFDAGTTNVLVVGTSTDDDHYVDAGDVYETLISTTTVRDKVEQVTSDTTVYAKYTQTGSAATAGAARIVVHYIVPGS